MNKHIYIKLETACGNRTGCRVEAEEVVELLERLRGKPIGDKRDDAASVKTSAAIAFGDVESGG